MVLLTNKARESNEVKPWEIVERKNRTALEQLSMYEQLLPGMKLGKAINSPFRKDQNPSFCVYKSKKSDNIYWIDYGSGERGNIDLLMALMKNEVSPMPTKAKVVDWKNTLDFVSRSWAKTDYDIWAHWGIRRDILELYDVRAVNSVLNNGIGSWRHRIDNPIYAYVYGKSLKIYRPFAIKSAKWKCDIYEDDIQGYEQLPDNGDLLIITKSMKDVMCLRSLGYYAVASSSETTFISRVKFLELKKRFKKIILLYDNDKTGVKSSEDIKEKHKIDYMLIPKSSKCKDVSEYYQNFGNQATQVMLREIICDTINNSSNKSI